MSLPRLVRFHLASRVARSILSTVALNYAMFRMHGLATCDELCYLALVHEHAVQSKPENGVASKSWELMVLQITSKQSLARAK
jgi:isoprenylcysteine carboxyl methyltransferase (ICMT) family protein YpbQ